MLLKKLYGMSPEEYSTLMAAQGGKCAICRSSCPRGRLSVDHNHETGEIRGLLCRDCNRALGIFRDDPDRLRKAAEYLEKG